MPPGPVVEHRARWSSDYRHLREVIEAATPGQLVMIRHVGSTAIPGLPAKGVIDIDLTVHDVTAEAAYLPGLEQAGLRLIFRDDVAGDPHRQLTYAVPNANVHVWSPGAVEPQRHALFVQWLCSCEADRKRYAEVKRLAARDPGARRYNDLKSGVVYDIYERAFLADPAHQHEGRPRPQEA